MPAEPPSIPLPRGFACHVANIGIKDDTDDFVVVAADTWCAAAGLFTKSRFSGPSVVVSRAPSVRSALASAAALSASASSSFPSIRLIPASLSIASSTRG